MHHSEREQLLYIAMPPKYYELAALHIITNNKNIDQKTHTKTETKILTKKHTHKKPKQKYWPKNTQKNRNKNIDQKTHTQKKRNKKDIKIMSVSKHGA